MQNKIVKLMQRTKNYSLIFLITTLLILRVSITNINKAEWGDSYRILRASNFIRNFSYPKDEKRPPLFSALLAIRPQNVDPVFWGRGFMLFLYLLTLFVFYKYLKFFFPYNKQKLLALAFLIINPVYLYWSLRIYADLLFSFFVLCSFYAFENYKQKPNIKNLFLMGFLCGLAVLTRFEGYLLSASLAFSIFTINKKPSITLLKELTIFAFGFTFTSIWWLIYQNPLSSAYFQEAKERSYGLRSFAVFSISYLYMLGSVTPFALILNTVKIEIKEIIKLINKYPNIFAFIILESILIMLWPAAVPRLFVSLAPVFVVFYVKSLKYFDKDVNKKTGVFLTSLLLWMIYILAQGAIREQFFGSQKTISLMIVVLGLASLFAIYFKLEKIYIASSFFSALLMSFSVIYIHKNIYASIREITSFPLREIVKCDKTWHNDLSGIVSWYIPNSDYKNFDNKKYLELGYLEKEGVDCLIITNEFNPDMQIDLGKRPYLSLTNKSEIKRGGKIFFTWLIKVNK